LSERREQPIDERVRVERASNRSVGRVAAEPVAHGPGVVEVVDRGPYDGAVEQRREPVAERRLAGTVDAVDRDDDSPLEW
jgi:hypothetical protein